MSFSQRMRMRAACMVRECGDGGTGSEPADRGEGEVEARLAVK